MWTSVSKFPLKMVPEMTFLRGARQCEGRKLSFFLGPNRGCLALKGELEKTKTNANAAIVIPQEALGTRFTHSQSFYDKNCDAPLITAV